MEGHAAHAAAMLDFLAGLHLLTAHDKRGVLKLVKGLDPSSYELIARSGHGISVFRTATCSNNRIYRVTGMGEVAADPQVVFELLCNFELIPEWDMLFKSAAYLSYARDPAGACEVATIHLVYGLPGVSRFVSDRDFILRVVRVFFPDGMHVLFCHSLSPDEEVPGDPGPTPHVIRGHMWESGYVVVPTRSGCLLNITLQVDPKGWIPTSVVNWSLEAIPLNMPRIRAALQRLDPTLLAMLPELNRKQASKRRQQQRVGPEPSAAAVGNAALRLYPQRQPHSDSGRGEGAGSSGGEVQGIGRGSSSASSSSSSSSSNEAGQHDEGEEEEEEEDGSEWFDA